MSTQEELDAQAMLDAYLRHYGVSGTVARLQDWTQLSNLVMGHTVAEPTGDVNLTGRFLREWQPISEGPPPSYGRAQADSVSARGAMKTLLRPPKK